MWGHIELPHTRKGTEEQPRCQVSNRGRVGRCEIFEGVTQWKTLGLKTMGLTQPLQLQPLEPTGLALLCLHMCSDEMHHLGAEIAVSQLEVRHMRCFFGSSVLTAENLTGKTCTPCHQGDLLSPQATTTGLRWQVSSLH